MTASGWEKAARNVQFPVVVLVRGVTDSPRLTQWGDEEEAPSSVTLAYEAEEIQITTYRDLMWGDLSPWKDLEAFVEDSFGLVWGGGDLEAPAPEEVNVEEEVELPTGDHIISTTYIPLPEGIALEKTQARKKAAINANHRVIGLPLGSSSADAIVVSEADRWVAGLEVTAQRGPLCVLLTGGAISIESLKLELTYDLPRHLHLR